MNEIAVALREAGRLIVSLDATLAQIVLLSLQVSLTAVVLSAALGLPLGAAIAEARDPMT